MNTESLKKTLSAYPRVPLVSGPTPLESLDRFAHLNGLTSIFIKRDDLTGLALGGNKTRKLEWIMGDVLAQGCDTVLTWGSWQSNWCRQVAAAGAKMGVETHLILFHDEQHPGVRTANALIDTVLGAHIHPRDTKGQTKLFHLADIWGWVDEVADDLRARGKRVYLVGVGGSMVEGSMTRPLGALAYLDAFLEMLDQARSMGVEFKNLVVTSGSASTQAGILAGALLFSPSLRVHGVSVTLPASVMGECVADMTGSLLSELGLPRSVPREVVIVHDRFMGKGYGLLDEETLKVIRLLARSEGILLDPVYSGKGMRGFLDLARSEAWGDPALFWHTGGTPALFAYGEAVF